MKKNRKKLAALVVIVTMVLSMFSVAYATGTYQTLKAWYGDIKIVANGQQITSDVKPFIVNSTTYVPLRMISEALNKEVLWDGSTYTISINDKPDQTNVFLWQQLFTKDEKIAELEAKVKALENDLENNKTTDLDDLEDDLMYYYDEYEDIEFDIYLYGDEDEIEVEIYVDLDEYEDEWNDLRDSDIEDYLQDIVDEILDVDEFEDADIEGFIEDDDSGDELVWFDIDYRGNVDFDHEDDVDLDDLEDDLNWWYGDYNGAEIDIFLYGDEDDITVELSVDEDEWDDLTNSEIDDLLDWIVEDTLDEFEDADIDGYVEDWYSGDELLSFYVDSRGNVVID